MRTAKRVGIPLFGSLAVAVALVVSCASPTGGDPVVPSLSNAELLDFQSHYMTSYNAYSYTPVTTASARVTIPVGSPRPNGTFGSYYPTGVAFAGLLSGTQTLTGYPVTGQTTSFTVTRPDPNHPEVYRITAVTTFPSADDRASYTEIYDVQDVGIGDPNPDGNWTSDDPVVKLVGGTWTQNQAARVSQTLKYRNNDTRYEVVGDVTTRYYLPLMTDTMQVKNQAVPTVVPSTDTSGLITWSSVTAYVTKPDSLASNSYWNPTTTPPNIIGVRFYSEDKNGQWSSVALERIVAEPQNLADYTLQNVLDIVLTNGLAVGSTQRTFTTLGTSVVRENATSKTMAASLVSNNKNVTYQITLDTTGTILLIKTQAGQLITF